MTKRQKIFDKIVNNPRDVSFSDIRKLLEQEDFILERVSGSHHVFKKNSVTFIVPVHNNKVKTVYVKRVIELIEEARDEQI